MKIRYKIYLIIFMIMIFIGIIIVFVKSNEYNNRYYLYNNNNDNYIKVYLNVHALDNKSPTNFLIKEGTPVILNKSVNDSISEVSTLNKEAIKIVGSSEFFVKKINLYKEDRTLLKNNKPNMF